MPRSRPINRLTVLLALTSAGLIWWISQQLRDPGLAVRAVPNGGYSTMPVVDVIPAEPFTMPPRGAFAEIVERPLFSPTRRPPPPPDATKDAAARREIKTGQFSLTGVIISAEGRYALVEDLAGTETYRVLEGETMRDWRVEQILPDSIVLVQRDVRDVVLLHDPSAGRSPKPWVARLAEAGIAQQLSAAPLKLEQKLLVAQEKFVRRQRAAQLQDPSAPWELDDDLLSGSSKAMAASALQERVQAAAAKSGSELVRTEVLKAETVGKMQQITITIELETDQGGLQEFLYWIEAGRPALFVDNLDIRPSRSRLRRRMLAGKDADFITVNADVFGFRRLEVI
ncbi:MAG: type II secretion system protein GspM [Woeseia sp.]